MVLKRLTHIKLPYWDMVLADVDLKHAWHFLLWLNILHKLHNMVLFIRFSVKRIYFLRIGAF